MARQTGLWQLALRAVRDLRPARYPLDPAATVDSRGPFPLDWRTKTPAFVPRNAEGIVLTPIGSGAGAYLNPVAISLHALARHTALHHGAGPAEREDFLRHATHLLESQDDAGGWRYPVSVPRYGVGPGWYSAMAQGLAAAVFLRAFDQSASASYRDASERAAALLLKPVEDGGCNVYDEWGRPFLEECPASLPPLILNGAIFALIGLMEVESRWGGSSPRAVAARLADQIGEYDLGYWSRYDLRYRAPATQAYHSLHVSLLRVLGRMTGMDLFTQTAERWASYGSSVRNRLRAALGKARMVVAVDGI